MKMLRALLGAALCLASPVSAQITGIDASLSSKLDALAGKASDDELTAIRAGNAWTVTAARATVAAGRVYAILLVNNETFPIYLTHRIFSCNNPISGILPEYLGLSSPTANLPVSAMTTTNRGGGAASNVTVTANVQTNAPTGPTTPNGGFFGIAFDLPIHRKLLPGQSFTNWIVGSAVPSGLGMTDAACAIQISWIK